MAVTDYVVKAFLPYEKNGLIKTLGQAPDSAVIIPDPSILPSVSSLNGAKLDTEKQGYIGDTISVVLSVLSHPKTLVLPKIKSLFQRKTEEEISALKKHDQNNLLDRYERFRNKLDNIKIQNPKNGFDNKFTLIYEMLNFLDIQLDLKQKDDNNFEKYTAILAFAASMAVSDPKETHGILTLDDKIYSTLFDSLFGIAYTQVLSQDEIGKLRNVAKGINNPRLKIISCDLDQANQPFVAVRDTEQKLIPSREYQRLPAEKQKEILVELRRYLQKLNLVLRGEVYICEGRTISIKKPVESKPTEVDLEKKVDKEIKKIDKPKDQSALGRELKSAFALSASQKIPAKPPEKIPDAISNPISNEIEKKKDDKKNKLNYLPEKTKEKPSETYDKKLKIDEVGLTALYEQTRLPQELISETYFNGKLKPRILAYKSLREIASQAGSEKIIKEIDFDLKNIERYLRETKRLEVEELKRRFEKETETLEGCLGLLENLPNKPELEKNLVEKIVVAPTPSPINSKNGNLSIEEKVRIIEYNLEFLLKRKPHLNEPILKELYRASCNIEKGGLSQAIRRAQKKGLLDEADLCSDSGSRNIDYNPKISFALASVISKAIPKKLGAEQEIQAETENTNPNDSQKIFDSRRAIMARKKAGLFQNQLGVQLGGLRQSEISNFELGHIKSPNRLGERGMRYYKWLFEQEGYNPYNLNFDKPQEGVAPSTSGSS